MEEVQKESDLKLLIETTSFKRIRFKAVPKLAEKKSKKIMASSHSQNHLKQN